MIRPLADENFNNCICLRARSRRQAHAGLFEVGRTVAVRSSIGDIVLLAACSEDGEWEGQVHYLPLP